MTCCLYGISIEEEYVSVANLTYIESFSACIQIISAVCLLADTGEIQRLERYVCMYVCIYVYVYMYVCIYLL